MNDHTLQPKHIYKYLPHFFILVACMLFILSIFSNNWQADPAHIGKSVEIRVDERVDELDRHLESIKNTNDYYSTLKTLPKDLVIYVYKNDSLKFWGNQFPVFNDDISHKLVFQRLSNLKNRIDSPLAQIPKEYSFINLGPKWYIIKKVQEENNKTIIAGVEIQNSLINDLSINDNGSNPRLKVPINYTIHPLSTTGGEVIHVQGKPMFKILYERTDMAPFYSDSLFRWISLGLLCLATLLILKQNRKFKFYLFTIGVFSIALWIALQWSDHMQNNTELFSPITYADEAIFSSLGNLLLINTFFTLICIATYIIRKNLFCLIVSNKKNPKVWTALYGLSLLGAIVFIVIYTQITLTSLLENSNISLELYRWNTDIPKTALVYFSYIALTFCIMLLLQMTGPVVWKLFRIKYNSLSRKSILAFSLCTAAYFSILSGVKGFQRETERIEIWANRLAVNRDIDLELQLLSIEDDIANDTGIATLIAQDDPRDIILNRLSESHVTNIRHNYNINAQPLSQKNPGIIRHYKQLIESCEPISEGSRFMYYYDALGSCKYLGSFIYRTEDNSYRNLIIEIESKANSGHQGYYSILSRLSASGEINIPSFFSYAKYTNDKLVSYKGHFPYPTAADEHIKEGLKEQDNSVLRFEDHTHFLHKISDTETIIISRPSRSALVFFISFSYIFLVLFGLLQFFVRKRKKQQFKSNFFKRRINITLFVSSTLILASLTVVSIYFVYKRNDDNMKAMMSSRINTIQALINTHTHSVTDYTDMKSTEFRSAIKLISNTTKSDITLYTPEGQVFYSSAHDIFDKMLLGNRLDQDAFYNITSLNQRFYINQGEVGDISYWGLYAPILNNKREIVAILGSPYTDEDVNFHMEAFFHAALLINVFLLLLIISLIFSTREVNSLFTPLVEMGKKMNKMDIQNMEPIVYKREDEISSLVEAYNRMVKELSDSTIRLAQVERDKAWSQMARQVAHEIKNPLTPIKLEIQRLIRLKENNNPKWEEKFDTVSAVILEHIDILTDTANEFSTFAKLYTEEPVLVDLEKVLKEQILIFNNKENISIEYIGMENAYVMVPKPQFIRVLVNLITNALQAVEIRQKEEIENGGEAFEGKVLICLRNGAKDDFFDIVIDDNGSGVSEENQNRLFTPNFTTKSGGTGLGLAICRNIIEKCDGEIGYRKSYSLGGASFYISIPKYKNEAI